MEDRILVSVIIPVYNAEEHLRQCLDSVVCQTLREIEIICVDDGSTDDSLEILYEYESKDPRVRVLTQKKQYAGVARNHGMKQAQGQYYIFLDADDLFELNMLEAMYRQAKAFDADICLCGADCFDMQSCRYEPMPGILNLRETIEQPFNANDLKDIYSISSPAPWSKLFSAEFIRRTELKFQSVPRINDLFFTYSALALAERIVYVNEVFVHYRIGQNKNLQSSIYKTPVLCCEVLTAVKERLQEEPCWEHVKDSFVNAAIVNLENSFRCMKEYPEERRELAEAIDCEYYQSLGIQNFPVTKVTDWVTFERFQLALLEERYKKPGAPLISLIVQVYNSGEHLGACLDSLLDQSLENIEIICINDASQDSSLQILRNRAARDSRIRVIEKKRDEKTIHAIQKGVQEAQALYIMFIDPNDRLDPDACKIAYDRICEASTDILEFTCGAGNCSDNIDEKKQSEDDLSVLDLTLSRKELREGFLKRNISTSLMDKIYYAPKCKLAYQNMPEGYCSIGEDLLQQFFLFWYADTYRVISTNPLYWYGERSKEKTKKSLDPSIRHEACCSMSEYDQRFDHSSDTQQNDVLFHLMRYFYCALGILKYALDNRYEQQREHELWQAYYLMIEASIQCYKELSDDERKKIAFQREVDQELFNQVVVNNEKNKLLYGEIERVNKELNSLQSQLDAMNKTVSFRIGRIITWFPRKIRSKVRWCRTHGIPKTTQEP